MSRTITYLPLSELRANPRNPKAHDLDTIDASIGRFGVVEAVVQDQRTGYIVSGHGRAETLRSMEERGETPPEGVQVDSDGHWLVPVVTGWASRTDTEAAAALIALNRTTELGGWVDDELLELLDDLDGQDDGLLGVGFTTTDVDVLRAFTDRLTEESPVDHGEMDDDEFEELVDGATAITLTITGLTNAEVSRFRELPGESDADRFRSLFDD